MTIKQRICYILGLFKDQKVQVILLVLFTSFSCLFFINPINGAAPYQNRPKTVQEFQNMDMNMFLKMKINATIPEGDSLFEDNGLGWQIIDVVYNQKETLSSPVIVDAQSETTQFSPGSSEEIIYFNDKYWWETAPFSFIGKPFLPSSNLTNIYFKEQYKGEIYQYRGLGENIYDTMNLYTGKISGYKYSTTLLSPAQLAVYYCNSLGYTYHDILNASTQYLTGYGGLTPNYITEYRAQPCEIDYNLSMTNPTCYLVPMNGSEADSKNVLGIKAPFSTTMTGTFQTISPHSEDGFAGLIVGAICLIATAAVCITSMITSYLNDQGNRDFWETVIGYFTYAADAYTRGRNDAANDFEDTLIDLIIDDPELRDLLGNNSEEVYTRLKNLIHETNTIVVTNYTNPYDLFPGAGGNPFNQPSLVEITKIVIAVTIIIVVIVVIALLIAWKIRKGKKKKGSDGGSEGSGDQNITVIKATPQASLSELFNFGLSTGAI